MAFTRKFLAALGIESDKIDEIMDAHVEVVNGLKTERDAFKTDADKLAETEKKLEEANKKLAKNGGAETVSKEEYDKVNTELTKLKDGIKAKETKDAKTSALREFYKGIGVAEKYIDTVIRATPFDDVELDDKGKIKDEGNKRSEKAKTDWADFVESTEEHGAKLGNPPGNNGGSVKDYENMSMEEYVAARKKGQ